MLTFSISYEALTVAMYTWLSLGLLFWAVLCIACRDRLGDTLKSKTYCTRFLLLSVVCILVFPIGIWACYEERTSITKLLRGALGWK